MGRSGTYIALDVMMQLIAKGDFSVAIDVFDFVLSMRECRVSMVQTEVSVSIVLV